MRVVAPAKVNLRLIVLAREESGYHQLETLFCAIDLADEVHVTVGGDTAAGIRLDVDGARLGPPRENLVCLAAEAFFDAAGRRPAARLRLTKRIPAGAGLGGGSSDAAAALRALNTLHGHPLPDSVLLRLAFRLGSDVPFFLSGSTLALAWGRGERLLPLPPLPPAPVLLAVPPFQSPTAEAYRLLAEHREATRHDNYRQPRILPLEAVAAWPAIAAAAANDFEPPLFARYPVLGVLKDALLDAGAIMALLAGSGSAVFAVFAAEDARDRAADGLETRFPETRFVTATTGSPGDRGVPGTVDDGVEIR